MTTLPHEMRQRNLIKRLRTKIRRMENLLMSTYTQVEDGELRQLIEWEVMDYQRYRKGARDLGPDRATA